MMFIDYLNYNFIYLIFFYIYTKLIYTNHIDEIPFKNLANQVADGTDPAQDDDLPRVQSSQFSLHHVGDTARLDQQSQSMIPGR
jgi:hypothetical protein